MATSGKDLGDKKWNGEQNPNIEHERNEGFSSENIPEDYNPAPLKTESDIDSKGNPEIVQRARHEAVNPNHKKNPVQEPDYKTGNEIIEDPELMENKDRNYDVADNRYPSSHPDNKKHRGNINPGK
ncbi:MAG: hypothetical protein ITG00_04090 [Flavobacterium sp.]|nr:hypothetical protein [Flavobacterium sp.]